MMRGRTKKTRKKTRLVRVSQVQRKAKSLKNMAVTVRTNHRSQLRLRNCENGRARSERKGSNIVFLGSKRQFL